MFMLEIISIVSTVVMIVLIGIVLKLPDLITQKWLETIKNKNAHDIQIESYFKQLGGKQQQEVLASWTDFLTDMDGTIAKISSENPDALKIYKKLMHDTIIYGSDRTVKLISAYNSATFALNKSKQFDPYKMMVYIAYIVSSLKEDFSGYYISPLALLKISIKDYDSYASEYERGYESIKKELMK